MTGESGKSAMERRVAERVDLKVEVRWRRIGGRKASALVEGGAYSEIFAPLAPELPATADELERQAYTENLSTAGLKLVGDLRLQDGSALQEGWDLLVEITAPFQKEPIRAIAGVVWITPEPAPRQAGLFFKAINKEDVEKVLRLQAEAKKAQS
jgi:hypothetical protein